MFHAVPKSRGKVEVINMLDRLSEAAIAYPQLLEAKSKAVPGDGFDPFDYATDLERSTDDCLRFADGIECIMWRGGQWVLEGE
jgi:hypothetical protein